MKKIASDKLEKLTQKKLRKKEFQLGEIVWYALSGLVPVKGKITHSDIGQEKYKILVYSECFLAMKFFEVTDKEIAKTKEELMEAYAVAYLRG